MVAIAAGARVKAGCQAFSYSYDWSSLPMNTQAHEVRSARYANDARALSGAVENFGFAILTKIADGNDGLRRIAESLGSINLSADEVLTGPPIMEMTVNEARASEAKEPAYFTKDQFPLHTDLTYIPKPPKYLLMHCIRPDPEGGGATVLSDCQAAFERLTAQHRTLLATRSFLYRNPPGCPSGYAGPFAVFSEYDQGGPIFRLKRGAMQFPDDVTSAIDAFVAALGENVVEHFLDCDELIVIDNHRWAHGRTAFGAANASDRLLRRAYAEV